MLKVYIGGAYSADNVIDVLKNIGKGERLAARVFADGFAPFTPWHDKDFIIKNPDECFTVEQFYNYSLAWLAVSDCLVLVEGNWANSEGTKREIDFCIERGIPFFYNYADFLRWVGYQKTA